MARICKVITASDDKFPTGGIQLKAGEVWGYLIQDDTCLVQVGRRHGKVVRERFKTWRYVRGPEGPVRIEYYNTDPEYFEHENAKISSLIYERLPDIPGPAVEVADRFLDAFDPPQLPVDPDSEGG